MNTMPTPFTKPSLRGTLRFFKLALAAFATALIAACGGGSSSSGTLRVALTDAPACGYEQVLVTIESVRIHKSNAASASDGGWVEIALPAPKTIDLLSLQNGALAELGQTALESGRYTQMRLVLAASGHAIKPTGGVQTTLSTPSALQTGLKMNIDLEVAANQLLDLVIDFDACRSVVAAGRSGRYNLKPVLSVTPRYVSGVRGSVETSLASTASLTLQSAGEVVKATAARADGSFLLAPVAPGTYELVLSAPGRATAVVSGVKVTADTVTEIGNAPLAPPTSTSGTVSGTVSLTPAPALIDATVRVQQALQPDGPTVEVARRNADAATGEYSVELPTAAPVRASFTSSGAALSFAPASSAAGSYLLSARSGTAEKGPFSVTVAAGGNVTQGFAFP